MVRAQSHQAMDSSRVTSPGPHHPNDSWCWPPQEWRKRELNEQSKWLPVPRQKQQSRLDVRIWGRARLPS